MNNANELRAYRDSVYADYSEVDKFERQKKRLIGFLILFTVLLNLGKLFMFIRISDSSSFIFLLIGVVVGMGPYLIFLLAAMSPKWKIACVLYLIVAQQLFQFFRMLPYRGLNGLRTMMLTYIHGFWQSPLFVLLDIFSWILLLLILFTAIWLTLIPKNRRLAEQSEQLNAQVQKYIFAHTK